MRRIRWFTYILLAISLLGASGLSACSGASRPAAVASSDGTPSMVPQSTTTPMSPATATSLPSATPSVTPTPPPPPRVVASYPVSDDFAVDPSYPVHLVFDQEMDMASVAASLSIEPSLEGELRVVNPKELMIVPDGGWTAEAYQLVVTTDATDPWGQPLQEPFTLTFETTGSSMVLPILMYHRLAELEPDATEAQRTWTVHPDSFAEQMRYLAGEGYHSIGPRELYAYWTDQAPLPPRPVIITMDDGYADLHSVALPIFQETGLRPVLFIFPKVVGYGLYIDWDHLQELVDQGFVVGSHSYDHDNLREMDDAALRYQIVDSRQILEERLGTTVDSFCYPYGGYDQRTLDLLKSEGYTTGFTLNPTYYQRAESPLLLGRLRVDYAMSFDEFVELLP